MLDNGRMCAVDWLTNTAKNGDSTLLPRGTPIRILFDIPTKSLEISDRFASARECVDENIPALFAPYSADSTPVPLDTRLVAVEIRGKHTFAILDSSHSDYDFFTARERQHNNLPVYLVDLKQRDRPLVRRAPKFDRMINNMVGEMHRLNGYEVRTPYYLDYGAGVMCYLNPRGLKMAAPKEGEVEVAAEKGVEENVPGETT